MTKLEKRKKKRKPVPSEQLPIELVVASRNRQRQVAKATKLRMAFRQSQEQFLMTFEEYRDPVKRAAILAGYGLDD